MRADQRFLNGIYQQPQPAAAPANPADKPLLLTRSQAAKFLGIGERTLWQLTADGKISCVKLGYKLVRYDVRDLIAFVDRHKQRGRVEGGDGDQPPSREPSG